MSHTVLLRLVSCDLLFHTYICKILICKLQTLRTLLDNDCFRELLLLGGQLVIADLKFDRQCLLQGL